MVFWQVKLDREHAVRYQKTFVANRIKIGLYILEKNGNRQMHKQRILDPKCIILSLLCPVGKKLREIRVSVNNLFL